MGTLLLVLAGIGEIVGVVGFERLTRARYLSGTLVTTLGFGGGLTALHFAMAFMPMAIAYGVFTGMGAVGSAALGIAFWGDSARPARLACIAAIVIAVIGLRLSV